MPLPTIFVLLTVMIDAIGVGLIMPVMPDLIQEVTGSDLADAAIWGGVLTTVFAVMQFFFGPVVGNLSDRFGRRPILLGSLAILAVDYVVMAVAGTIWLLLLGRVVGGMMAATQSTAYAYMGDVSEDGKKAAGFGLIGAAFGIGFVLGPIIGGLLGAFGTRAPFWAAAALAALTCVMGFLVLKETVTDDTRRPFEWRRANPFGAFLALDKLPGVGRGLALFFFYQVAFMVYPTVWAYYGTAQFGWDPLMIGLSLGLFGVAMAIVQGGVIRLILARLGERGTVIYGLVFDIFVFAALAVVTSGTVVLVLVPVAALAAVITPALQGILSAEVGPKRQGELQGALTSVGAVAMIISPMIMTPTFAYFTSPGAPVYAPGAPFGLSMLLILAGLVVFLWPAKPKSVA